MQQKNGASNTAVHKLWRTLSGNVELLYAVYAIHMTSYECMSDLETAGFASNCKANMFVLSMFYSHCFYTAPKSNIIF